MRIKLLLHTIFSLRSQIRWRCHRGAGNRRRRTTVVLGPHPDHRRSSSWRRFFNIWRRSLGRRRRWRHHNCGGVTLLLWFAVARCRWCRRTGLGGRSWRGFGSQQTGNIQAGGSVGWWNLVVGACAPVCQLPASDFEHNSTHRCLDNMLVLIKRNDSGKNEKFHERIKQLHLLCEHFQFRHWRIDTTIMLFSKIRSLNNISGYPIYYLKLLKWPILKQKE